MQHHVIIFTILACAIALVTAAPSPVAGEHHILHDVNHSFSFGYAEDGSNLTAWNKGVHLDKRSNTLFQLYTLDRDQRPTDAIRGWHVNNDKRELRKRRDLEKRGGGNGFIPLSQWKPWDCKPDKPCSLNLEDRHRDDIKESPYLGKVFCRPWQLSGRDPPPMEWELQHNYHECGLEHAPWDWMFKYGMRNTSSMALELFSHVFGLDRGRAQINPRAVCLDDHDWGRFCFSWDGAWGTGSIGMTTWLKPEDILTFHGMSMMCLHNGHSAAGEIKTEGALNRQAICFSDRPEGCTIGDICRDNYSVRLTYQRANWAGKYAHQNMIMGGDLKGPRIDHLVRPDLVPKVSWSMGARYPWLLTNESIKSLRLPGETPDKYDTGTMAWSGHDWKRDVEAEGVADTVCDTGRCEDVADAACDASGCVEGTGQSTSRSRKPFDDSKFPENGPWGAGNWLGDVARDDFTAKPYWYPPCWQDPKGTLPFCY